MGLTQVRTLVFHVKELWDTWNLRICLLFSLMLQASLTYGASSRKRHKSSLLQIWIKAAFSLADWIAAYGVGQILQSQNNDLDDPNKNGMLSYFWAQFLLLHLAGPDNIISFSPRDNELWLRLLFGLVIQVLATAYSLYLFILVKNDKLWIPSLLVFIVASIKWVERVKALYDASSDRFGETLLPKPCPGPDYEDAVATGQIAVPADMQSGEIPSTMTITVDPNTKVGKFDFLLHAGSFIDDFKVLFTGSFLSFQKREESREYFLSCRYSDAFRLIEYELSCLYDLMHTKVAVFNNPLGYIFRFICFSFVLLAFIFYLIAEKQRYATFDVALTYAMLIGIIVLDIISLINLIFSDWSILRRPKMIRFIPVLMLKRKRWSRSVFQYTMFTCCLYKTTTRLLYSSVDYIFDLTRFVDKMRAVWHSSSETVTKELEEFIFNELKMKSIKAKELNVAKELCSQRGLSALLQGSSASNGTPPSHTNLEWSIKEFHYLDSLLLWHLATELCLHDLDENSLSAESKNQIKICKLLSDYMFYLLVMQPTILSPDMGNWSIVFQDTRAEAMGFFIKHSISHHRKAFQKLISVETPYRPAAVKGSASKSLLFDACILAKQLRETEEQWEVMSRVWMELMSFGAMSCSPTIHAQQPGRGGELLTITWLLMYHLGLGTQFSEPLQPLAPTS